MVGQSPVRSLVSLALLVFNHVKSFISSQLRILVFYLIMSTETPNTTSTDVLMSESPTVPVSTPGDLSTALTIADAVSLGGTI